MSAHLVRHSSISVQAHLFDTRGILLVMALHEGSPAPAPKERIHQALVMAAASKVGITEFILLRLRSLDVRQAENDQIKKVASIIRTEQMEAKEEKVFNLSDEIEQTLDPLKAGARRILKKVSLPEYLTAKRAVIVQAIEVNETDKLLYSSLVGWEEQRSRVEEKGKKLAGEFELINKVIWESGGLPRKTV